MCPFHWSTVLCLGGHFYNHIICERMTCNSCVSWALSMEMDDRNIPWPYVSQWLLQGYKNLYSLRRGKVFSRLTQNLEGLWQKFGPATNVQGFCFMVKKAEIFCELWTMHGAFRFYRVHDCLCVLWKKKCPCAISSMGWSLFSFNSAVQG